MRTQIELSNEVAAELAGSQDAVLRALEAHLDCKVFLRGNLLTLDGEESETQRRRARRARARRPDRPRPSDRARARSPPSPARSTRTNRRRACSRTSSGRHRGLRVAPKTVNQKRYVDSIRASTITFGVGPAGTGKTFLAVAMAAAALSRHEVNRIILTRPAVEAGERLGFLPGDLMAKVDPYLRPLFDALHDMLDPEKVSQHIDRGVIEIAPLAFMRGRTLNDSFVILDEAQNTTPEQMKMFLTRLGFGSKMVVTGDITQVDLPREQQSGLIVVGDVLDAIEGDRVRALRRRGRRAPQARAADRRGLRRALAAPGRGARARPAGAGQVRRRRARDPQRLSGDARGRGPRRAAARPARPRRSGGRAAVRARGRAPRRRTSGHVAVEFVDAAADRRAQRAPPRHARAHRRAVVPDRRRRTLDVARRRSGERVAGRPAASSATS